MDKSYEELKKENEKLKQRIEKLKQREEEMEFLIEQYNNVMKEEFNSFDDFVQDLVNRDVIDDNSRVYSKKFFDKLFIIYYQKAFELKKNCGITILKLHELKNREKSSKKTKSLERNIGKYLRDLVRIPRDIISRYSFDTFVVLLTDIDENDFYNVSQRIKEHIKSFFSHDDSLEVINYYIPKEDVSTDEIFKHLEK